VNISVSQNGSVEANGQVKVSDVLKDTNVGLVCKLEYNVCITYKNGHETIQCFVLAW